MRASGLSPDFKNRRVRKHRTPFPSMRLVLVFCAIVAVILPARGQQTEPVAESTFTLHVYNNLVQFPTVVLSNNLTPLPPVPRTKFTVTIDDGPPFHPTQMRREGDDPIALAVLLDVSGNQDDLIAAFPDAFAKLMPAFLHPNDRISLYTQDCTVIRSLRNVPAEEKAFRDGVVAALKAPKLHGTKSKPACGDQLALWDGLAVVASELAQEPGRRVLLVLSDGVDAKSKTSFADTVHFVSAKGVAVFRIRDDTSAIFRDPTPVFQGRLLAAGVPDAISNPLRGLAESSGGMQFKTTPHRLARQLQDFITTLRNRYIIEFPRPDDQAPGRHLIAITIPGTLDFIRHTGATTPIADPAVLADPNTVPSEASPATFKKNRPPAQ